MCFRLTSHRCETAVRTFRFWSVTSPTSTLGVWESKSRVFPKRRWIRFTTTHGRGISGNCRILWREPPCSLPVHRFVCRWLKFSLTQVSTRLVGAMRWSKLGENRLCEHSAKAIGLSEEKVERQLAWASRGHRSPTRCRGWGSLAHHSDGGLASVPNLGLLVCRSEYHCPITPLAYSFMRQQHRLT